MRGYVQSYSFQPLEIDALRGALLDNFEIETTRVLGGGFSKELRRLKNCGKGEDQYIIRIPKRELTKVQGIVSPHIPSMMKYRIGLENLIGNSPT